MLKDYKEEEEKFKKRIDTLSCAGTNLEWVVELDNPLIVSLSQDVPLGFDMRHLVMENV